MKKKIFQITSTVAGINLFTPAYAVSLVDYDGQTVSTIVNAVVNWVLGLAAVTAILFIIYGGLLYITSAGNNEKAEAAKKTLTWAIIGLLIVVLSVVIVTIVTGLPSDVGITT